MTWWTDLRYALRTFRKNPAFTAFAVLTLALGLGANTAVFSFLDGVLLKPAPYPDADQIVQIWERPPQGLRNGVSALNFLDWQEQSTLFTGMAAATGQPMTLTGSGAPQQLRASQVSAPYFDVLGIKPALGRTFAAGEDQPGRERVVVLSNRIWQTRFGADPSVISRDITLNGQAHSIIGVMPPGDFDRRFFEIWTPLVLRREAVTRNFHYLNVTARMKPGVTIDQAKTEMSRIAAGIAERFPAIKKDWGATVDRLVDRIVNDRLRLSLFVLMSAVGAVLLIGCANLANLLLARGTLRSRELALRAALGAGRGRLIRQLLTESVVLSALGAAAGLILGYGLFQAILALLPRFFLPSQAAVGLDWRVMLFLTALALVTGVLFGLAPAFQGSRRDPADVLKEGGRGSVSGGARLWLRQSLVVAEVALAFILLVGAGLLIRSFQRLMLVDPGFDSTNVITMNLPLVERDNQDGARVTAYLDEILLQVRNVPGVQRAAMTSAFPMQGWGYGMPFRIDGTPDEGSRRQGAGFKMITPDYFSTLGMRLRKGRGFTDRDLAGAVPVMVVNETFAGRFFPKTEPIGKRIMVEQIITGRRELGPDIPWEIVGVVADEKVGSLDSTSAGMYVPFAQSPTLGVGLIAKGAGDPATFQRALQQAVWNVNKDQAIDNIRLLEEIKSESMAGSRLYTWLLGLFASIALTLSAIGIYGVLSYVTAQRTQELGVRAALGASSGDLIRLVIGNAALPLVIGLVLGVAGAFGLTRLLQTMLFEVTPTDPTTMVAVGVLLAAVGLLACYVPAHRASRIDPMIALRQE